MPKDRDEIRGQHNETLELLQEEETGKIRLRTEKRVRELRVEKQKMRNITVEKVKNEENEKVRCRTEKRLSELRIERDRKENEMDVLYPSLG